MVGPPQISPVNIAKRQSLRLKKRLRLVYIVMTCKFYKRGTNQKYAKGPASTGHNHLCDLELRSEKAKKLEICKTLSEKKLDLAIISDRCPIAESFGGRRRDWKKCPFYEPAD